MNDKNDQVLVEGIDFYLDESGNMVLTSDFLSKRGYCCQSACTNCPYDYKNKVDPSVPPEFFDKPEEEIDPTEQYSDMYEKIDKK